MLDVIVNIVVAIAAPCAVISLAHKKKFGFLIFIIVEVCYTYIGIKTQQYGIVCIAVFYFISNLYGYYKWSKDDGNKIRRRGKKGPRVKKTR